MQTPLTHTRGHSTRGRSEQSWQFSPLPRQVTRGKAKLLQQKLRRAHDLEPLPSAALRPRRSLPRTRHNRPGATDTGREGRRPSLGRRAAGAAEAARSSERDPDREDEPGPSAHLPAKPLLSCQRGRRARAPPPFPSFSGQENCTRPPKQNTDPRAQQDPKGQSTHVSCFHPAFPPPIPAEGPPVPCRTCRELLRRLSAGKTGGRGGGGDRGTGPEPRAAASPGARDTLAAPDVPPEPAETPGLPPPPPPVLPSAATASEDIFLTERTQDFQPAPWATGDRRGPCSSLRPERALRLGLVHRGETPHSTPRRGAPNTCVTSLRATDEARDPPSQALRGT